MYFLLKTFVTLFYKEEKITVLSFFVLYKISSFACIFFLKGSKGKMKVEHLITNNECFGRSLS